MNYIEITFLHKICKIFLTNLKESTRPTANIL